MNTTRLSCVTATLLCTAWLVTPASAQFGRRRGLDINTEGNADRCADLRVSSNGEIAQSADTFTLQRNEAPVLELTGMDRSVISVKGWDRGEYSVETCKVAVGETRAAAEQTLRAISVTHGAGRFSASGPADDANSRWQLYFFVHAPKDASLDLETKNGPISVAGIGGTVKTRATNGPISLSGTTGMVEANTANGPISFNGGGGEVHLTARNGPISLNLVGDMWNGSRLEAHTDNGPVSVNVPETYHSGVRIETSEHSPISCRMEACRNAWTDLRSNPRVIQLNGSQDTIRVSTHNGPVSVGGSKKLGKII